MFFNIIINDIILYLIFSIVITNLILGVFILFSISIVDFNLLSSVKYMFTNGIKKVAKGAGKIIIYGGGAAQGAKALIDLQKEYVEYNKNKI